MPSLSFNNKLRWFNQLTNLLFSFSRPQIDPGAKYHCHIPPLATRLRSHNPIKYELINYATNCINFLVFVLRD